MTIEKHIAKAEADLEAGFPSEAARKRTLEELSRAYRAAREALMTAILAARTAENEEESHADYWGTASDLHQVREKHIALFAKYGQDAQAIRDLIAFRQMVKDAEIAAKLVDVKAEKIEAVRRSIMEEMERRKATFVEGLDFTRMWNELFPRADGKLTLPISVTAHWVHGHKGTVFLRHFFYLRGKLTPLNTIIAIAEALEKEQAGA